MTIDMLDLTPHAVAPHWSARLVGLPWSPGAEGPRAYDCWGLVRWVQRHHYGRDLPVLHVNVREAPPQQWGALRELVSRSPWRPVAASDAWRDGDVLLMYGAEGPHVGTLVDLGGVLGVLHAVGWRDADGVDHGGVVHDAPESLGRIGFGRFEAWRWHA